MKELHPFEEFVERYQNLVFSTAWRMLGNDAEAEDIAQEVFLKAYERFDQLRDNPSAGAWLKISTRNRCLNHVGRFRRRWQLFSQMTASSPGNEEVDFAASIPAPDEREKEFMLDDYRSFLHRAMQRLSPAQRSALELFHYDDLSYTAIARKLGTSLAKVKRDIFRGREALRHKLALSTTGELGWRGRLFENPQPHAALAG
jgi:RNA polymerase sigma-70 factor (ECF subfamily)